MIVQEAFLKKLRSAFDLNIYEAKIWTALLSKGMATAGELADISNVPRSRSYDVLESLEKKGFIIMKVGKPIRYLAVEPTEIITRVKKQVRTKSEEQLLNLEEVRTTKIFDDLELLHKQGIEHVDPASLSGSLKGRANVYDQMESMFRNATKSITIMTTSKGLIRKVEMLKPVLRKLKDVKVKIAAPLDEKDAKEAAEELKDVAEVRHAKDIAGRFVVVDGKDVLFMVMDDSKVHESYDTGIWVNTPFFASALENMFELAWKSLKK